jgi:hypothetical protein
MLRSLSINCLASLFGATASALAIRDSVALEILGVPAGAIITTEFERETEHIRTNNYRSCEDWGPRLEGGGALFLTTNSQLRSPGRHA